MTILACSAPTLLIGTMQIVRQFIPLAGAMLVAGCASFNPTDDVRRAESIVGERSAHTPAWTESTWDAAGTEVWDGSAPLTADRAVRLALLSNRPLRADVISIHEARAAYAQAHLLPNPILTVSEGFVLDGGGGGPLAAGAMMQFAWLLTRDHAIAEADASLHAAVLDVSHHALDTRASMSMPLFFTPFHYQGRRLIDGGVLNPVPIAPTFSDHNELTIAVNLSGKVEDPSRNVPHADGRAQEAAGKNEETTAMRGMVHEFLASLRGRFRRGGDPDELDILEIANQAFDAMQGAISRHKLAAYPPDEVITIPRDVATVLEFDRAREMIDLGYEAAKSRLGGE